MSVVKTITFICMYRYRDFKKKVSLPPVVSHFIYAKWL